MSGYNKPHVHFLIASGQVLSDHVSLANARDAVSLWVPAVTSCQMYVQASFDTTSANFFRLQNVEATSTHVLNAADGSRVFTVPAERLCAGYVRLETSVAQTSPRSLVAMAGI